MGVFGVWCGKCAKYLAFGTFTTPAVDALTAFDFFLVQLFYVSFRRKYTFNSYILDKFLF